MKGFVGDLTPEQESALQEMKDRMSSFDQVQKDQFESDTSPNKVDRTILRFLRARDFNVDAAFPMLASCMTWRATFNGTGVKNITEESIARQQASHTAFYNKKDMKGRPLGYVLLRNHDPATSDFEELQRYCVFMIEQGLKLLDEDQECCSIVFDLDDIGLKNLDLKAVKFLIELLNQCYPEILGVCIVV
eukprot:TRINITY_DN1564_c0_g1_i1.p1 TRINITY_DN1564_c0_g1~~TRINITY_DN1564_c0_g1_i1.p1  ORF type:complete len:204 (+),score=58.08 TRINITY_DN1564_c0_g1_i1:43-612(+)